MYFDLNLPVPAPAQVPNQAGQGQGPFSKKKDKDKGKGKQQPPSQASGSAGTPEVAGFSTPTPIPTPGGGGGSASDSVAIVGVAFSPAQVAKVESRIDVLVRLGYTVIALNQVVYSKYEPKIHPNVLDVLLRQLRPRDGVLLLKRLTIVFDEESEKKGNGLTAANAQALAGYDVVSLLPTTQAAFSSACLTHSAPSSNASTVAHIITLPLAAPRLPFRMKHTLIRTAVKNGCVFEIGYAGVLGAAVAGGGEGGGDDARRNWWANARELVRVTKGKALVLSSGVDSDSDLRAPRDVGNLLALLGLAQNYAHDALTVTPKALLLRAQTRKTYRAVLSDPILVTQPRKDPASKAPEAPNTIQPAAAAAAASQAELRKSKIRKSSPKEADGSATITLEFLKPADESAAINDTINDITQQTTNSLGSKGSKRTFDDFNGADAPVTAAPIAASSPGQTANSGSEFQRRRKKKKMKAGDTA